MTLRSADSVGGRWRRDAGSSVIIKGVTLVPSALVGLWATRSMVVNYGVDGMALFSLVVAIPLLIPFADLGIGGAITELVAGWRTAARSDVMMALRRAVTILLSVATTLLLVATGLFLLGAWPTLLGLANPDANLAGFLVVAVFSLGVPTALGYRVLLGLQRTRQVVLLQSGASILAYGLAGISAKADLPLWLVATIPGFMTLCASGIAAVAAMRHFRTIDFGLMNSDGVGSTTKSSSLRALAWPMALIAVAVPVAYQSDRLVLGHLGTALELAIYAAAFQLYGPLNSLVTTAGQSLWPRLTFLRTGGVEPERKVILRLVLLFGLISAPIGVGLIVLGPMVSSWATNSEAAGGSSLFAMFALLLFVNAINYPVGMYMMGGVGLRIQAICIGLMAAANVGFTILLTPFMGANGPVLASVITVIVLVILPTFWWAFSRGARS